MGRTVHEDREVTVREERSVPPQVLDADRDEDSSKDDGGLETQSPEGAGGSTHSSEKAVSSSLIF